MKYDLAVLPNDWLLGLWWAEFGPGQYHRMPKGGQWFLVIRKMHPGNNRGLPTWVRGECIREWGAKQWNIQPGMSCGGALAQYQFARERQRWICEQAGGAGGWIDITGTGGVLAFLLAGGVSVPTWLRLCIIEHRAATERSASCGE